MIKCNRLLKECGQDSLEKLPLNVLAMLHVDRLFETLFFQYKCNHVGDTFPYLPQVLQKGYRNEETLENWRTGYGRPLTADKIDAIKGEIRKAKAMATWEGGYWEGNRQWRANDAGEYLWERLDPDLQKCLTNWRLEDGEADEESAKPLRRVRDVYCKIGQFDRDTWVQSLNEAYRKNPKGKIEDYIIQAIYATRSNPTFGIFS